MNISREGAEIAPQSNLVKTIYQAFDIAVITVCYFLAYIVKKYILPGPFKGLAADPNYVLVLLLTLVICFLVTL